MKTQTQLNSILGVAFLVLLLSIMSCDSAHPSKLVGYWVLYDYKSDNIGNNIVDQLNFLMAGMVMAGMVATNSNNSIELFKDGTGVETNASKMLGESKSVRFSWKVENKRFVKMSKSSTDVSDYRISGDTLTFIYNDGTSFIYLTKKAFEIAAKKAAEEAAKAEAEAAKAESAAIATLKAKAKKGSFTDARDNKTYKTVTLGDQTWLAENLDYDAKGSKCYDNNESNCQKYGGLYTWSAAKRACPDGWHLPTREEWDILVDFAGGEEVAGKKLKAKNGWNESGYSVDTFGFSALPGGSCSSDCMDDILESIGSQGYWWTATEEDAIWAYSLKMYLNEANVDMGPSAKTALFSVRCVMDD